MSKQKNAPVRTKETTQMKGPHKRPGFWRTDHYFKASLKGYERFRPSAKVLPSARRRHFCILLLPGKSMASGGTRTAGFAFSFSKEKQQQISDLLLSDYGMNSKRLNFRYEKNKPHINSMRGSSTI
jgi:hypothetical protein